MALTTTKTINLSGTSVINGSMVMSFNASIAQGNGSSNIIQNVVSQSLYEENKVEVRKDASAFTDLVYETEDTLATEVMSDDK